MPVKEGFVLLHNCFHRRLSQVPLMICQILASKKHLKEMVRAYSRCCARLPACAFPEGPSGTTKWTPRPDSHLPGPDGGRHGIHRLPDRTARPEDRCRPGTS